MSDYTAARPRYRRAATPRRGDAPAFADWDEPQRGRVVRAFSLLLGAALVAGGVMLMVQQLWVRSVDTAVVGWLLQYAGIGDVQAFPDQQMVVWQVGTPEIFGISVTAECTSAFLVGPAAILLGLIAMTGRFGIIRPLAALVLASSAMLIANWLRVCLVAWATANWGVQNGYQWSHTVVGSIIALAGVLIGALLAFRVLVQRRSRARRARTS